MEKLRCPKCGARSTWIEYHTPDIVLRCMCGLTKYLHRVVGDMTIMSTAVPVNEVKLPRVGTKIRRVLVAVATNYPHPINTSDIADGAGLKAKETSALLTPLMYRGLVSRVKERCGAKGGSTWELTVKARELLKVT